MTSKGSYADRCEWCLNCSEDLMPKWKYCPFCGTELHVTNETELEKLEKILAVYENELVGIERHLSAIKIQKRNAKSAINTVKVKIKAQEDAK